MIRPKIGKVKRDSEKDLRGKSLLRGREIISPAETGQSPLQSPKKSVPILPVAAVTTADSKRLPRDRSFFSFDSNRPFGPWARGVLPVMRIIGIQDGFRETGNGNSGRRIGRLSGNL
jgi:hypothetical protein